MGSVECNQCKAQFEIDLKTKNLPGGVEKVYFTCPKCEAEYVAYYTDPGIRAKQEKVRKLRKRLQVMETEVGQDMDKLRRRIEG